MLYEPLIWIVFSLGVYALAVNTMWLIATAPRRHPLGDRLLAAAADPGVTAVARAAYLLGIPLIALALRVPRPSHFGLAVPVSLLSLLAAGIITSIVLGLLVASRWWYAQALGLPTSLRRHRPSGATIARLTVTALLLETHWAFFRAGGLSVAGANVTLGVFVGLGLLGVEAWSNPWHRLALGDPLAVQRCTRTAALAVLSATVFLTTGSSVVSLAAHWVVLLAIAALWPDDAPVSHVPEPPPDAPAVEPTVV